MGEFFRYLVIGGCNTVFGYGAFSGLVLFGLHYKLAAILSLILGICFNYITYSLFVFHRHAPLSLSPSKIMKYLAVYGSVYWVNIWLLELLLRYPISIYIAQLICLPVVVLISYLGNKYISFKL